MYVHGNDTDQIFDVGFDDDVDPKVEERVSIDGGLPQVP